jgi:O-antigen/teichoic acid export membrane protein
MLAGGGRPRLAHAGNSTLIGGNESPEGTSALPAPTTGMKAKLEAINERFGMHSELLSNAGAIAIGTIGASFLGFVYWWVAARHFTPEAVGLAAAAISLMTLIGMIGELGLGTLLMGEVLINRRDAPGLVAASLITALLLSLALGAAFILLAPLIVSNFEVEFPTFDDEVLFIAGCAIMSFAMVLDQALIGWLKAIQQMSRNMLFAVLKLAMLVTVAIGGLVAVSIQEVAIVATWVFGQLAATLIFAAWLVTRGQSVWHKPEFGQLQSRIGKVLSHHFLNTVTQAPVLILPALVTFVMSPRTNAAFYAAFTLINVACYIPASLATVLFTIGSTDPASFSQRLKFSLKLSALIGVTTAVGFFILSQFILGIFNPEYPEIAGTSLQLMGAVALPAAIKYHFITIQRLMNRMTRGAVLLAIAGTFEVGMAFVGAQWYGLWGFTVGWVIASYIEAALMLPTIVKHLSSDAKLTAKPAAA